MSKHVEPSVFDDARSAQLSFGNFACPLGGSLEVASHVRSVPRTASSSRASEQQVQASTDPPCRLCPCASGVPGAPGATCVPPVLCPTCPSVTGPECSLRLTCTQYFLVLRVPNAPLPCNFVPGVFRAWCPPFGSKVCRVSCVLCVPSAVSAPRLWNFISSVAWCRAQCTPCVPQVPFLGASSTPLPTLLLAVAILRDLGQKKKRTLHQLQKKQLETHFHPPPRKEMTCKSKMQKKSVSSIKQPIETQRKSTTCLVHVSFRMRHFQLQNTKSTKKL